MSEPLQKHSRLPRKYAPATGRPKITVRNELGQNAGILKDIKPADIINRYLADERSVDIAASLGVTRSALNQWLLRTCQDDWKEAQVARAITRKEAAEEALELAADPLQLAKARESLKAAQWDLERTCRRIYGEEQQTHVVVAPILNITVAPTEQPRSIPMTLAHAPALAVDVQEQQSTAATPSEGT